jgi:hypothetical protein
MKKINLFVLYLAVLYGASLSTALAQETDDGGGSNAAVSALRSAEGKAVIFSSPGEVCGLLGVDARVYYTMGETSDTGVAAVSNPKIVRVGQGNQGD